MPMKTDNLPYMLYADAEGIIYDHPDYRIAGYSGLSPAPVAEDDLIPMPDFSKLFFIPDCPPLGLDPTTGEYRVVPEVEVEGVMIRCNAVAAFLEPGLVRSHLPAVDYGQKSYTLPMWSYTAVGYRDGRYWATGFQVEYNHRWDPRNFDDRELIPAVENYGGEECGNLIEHLKNCALDNHCFAAKNLFLKRWEAPIPVSRSCNAECLGCLSLQPDSLCEASHQRISFRPSIKEIVTLAVNHLDRAEDAIVSFGQGCEGEPLTEYELIAESIGEIRLKTDKGTINLNTNGSKPNRVRKIAESGLDSIRISLNSARPDLYRAYYRPKGYDFDEVVESIRISRELGLYTMVNYLLFPGISDQEEELDALGGLIRDTGVNFLHLKNLNIDPQLYLEKMPVHASGGMGMKKIADILESEFPELQLGYFNRAVRVEE